MRVNVILLVVACCFCCVSWGGERWLVGGLASADISWQPNPRKVATVGRLQPAGYRLDIGREGRLAYFMGRLQEPVPLHEMPYLELTVRSVEPGRHGYAFYIYKQDVGKPSRMFYTFIEVKGGDYQTIVLDTRRNGKGYYDAAKGCFIAPGGPGDHAFIKHGELTAFTFTSQGKPVSLELKAVRLLSAVPPVPRLQLSYSRDRLVPPYEFTGVDESRPNRVIVDGRSDYVICLRGGAPEFQFAAETLNAYFKRIYGVVLPVVSGAGRKSSIVLDIKPDGESLENFSISAEHDRIVISGNMGRSLVYGVYDFLEKACGVRFFAPLPCYEVVPRRKHLILGTFRNRCQAAFQFRRMNYCSFRDTTLDRRYEVADWVFKNRNNSEFGRLFKERTEAEAARARAFYRQRGKVYTSGVSQKCDLIWGHNYHNLIPPKTYFAAHPDYFCWNQVERKWQWKNAQICTTNPEVIRIIADRFEAVLKKDRDICYLPLFAEDGALLWCQCPRCSKLDAQGIGYSQNRMADRAFTLANAVRDELDRRGYSWAPICVSAYQPTRLPPEKTVVKPNILNSYCTYTDGTQDFKENIFNTQERPMLETWQKLCHDNMILYNYIYCGFFYQFTLDRNLADDYRYYHQIKLRGNGQETFEAWGFDDYVVYLGTRLLWNPWFDEEAFKRDYFSKLYGAAAPEMTLFHDLIQEVFADLDGYLPIGFKKYPHFSAQTRRMLANLLATAMGKEPEDARIQQVLQRKSKLLGYIETATDAIEYLCETARKPAPERFPLALQKCQKLKKLIIRLYRDGEIVACRLTSFADSMISQSRRLKQDYERQQNQQQNFDVFADLTGRPWRFRADKRNQGEKQHWEALKDYGGWQPMKAGMFWEDQGFDGYDGVGYYQLEVPLPAGQDLSKLFLLFEGADESAKVYVNGQKIFERLGDPEKIWKEPFMVSLADVTPAANGRYSLVVWVYDSGGKGGLYKPVKLLMKK